MSLFDNNKFVAFAFVTLFTTGSIPILALALYHARQIRRMNIFEADPVRNRPIMGCPPIAVRRK